MRATLSPIKGVRGPMSRVRAFTCLRKASPTLSFSRSATPSPWLSTNAKSADGRSLHLSERIANPPPVLSLRVIAFLFTFNSLLCAYRLLKALRAARVHRNDMLRDQDDAATSKEGDYEEASRHVGLPFGGAPRGLARLRPAQLRTARPMRQKLVEGR